MGNFSEVSWNAQFHKRIRRGNGFLLNSRYYSDIFCVLLAVLDSSIVNKNWNRVKPRVACLVAQIVAVVSMGLLVFKGCVGERGGM